MSTSESQLNGFGDNVMVESVAGIPPMSDVSGDQDHHKANLYDMQSQHSDPEKVLDSESEDDCRKSFAKQSTDKSIKQEDTVKPDEESLMQDEETLNQDEESVTQDEETVKQDELLFFPRPHDSFETDLDNAEQNEASIRQILHLGPTNSLTRASSVLDNYWLAEWGAYLLSHGIYMAVLSFIYLILVYASLEVLYYMTNKKPL